MRAIVAVLLILNAGCSEQGLNPDASAEATYLIALGALREKQMLPQGVVVHPNLLRYDSRGEPLPGGPQTSYEFGPAPVLQAVANKLSAGLCPTSNDGVCLRGAAPGVVSLTPIAGQAGHRIVGISVILFEPDGHWSQRGFVVTVDENSGMVLTVDLKWHEHG